MSCTTPCARDLALSASQRDLYLAEKVIESSLEGVMVTDARAHPLGEPAFTRMTGYAPEEVVGLNPSVLNSGRQSPPSTPHVGRPAGRRPVAGGEVWNRRKTGEGVSAAAAHITAIRDREGVLTHYAALFTDISRLKETEARIRDLAYYDPLTGLPTAACSTTACRSSSPTPHACAAGWR